MRAEAPDLTFDFTSILLNYGTGDEPGPKVTDAYPGDDYVDYIGIDVYDQGEMPSDIGVAVRRPLRLEGSGRGLRDVSTTRARNRARLRRRAREAPLDS